MNCCLLALDEAIFSQYIEEMLMFHINVYTQIHQHKCAKAQTNKVVSVQRQTTEFCLNAYIHECAPK